MSLNVLSIGGSRNIGYFSSIRLLDAGANVTFLLRSPSCFDSDEVIQRYVKEGKAHLIKGDALVKEDVQHCWDEAAKFGPVDALVFTVGTWGKGMVITPHNLVTQSLLNTLATMPKITPQPRIVAISSTGLTKTSHAALPLPLKPLYGWLLQVPHADKVGAERLFSHVCGWPWDKQNDGEPSDDIMGGSDWEHTPGLPEAGSLKRVVVVRPALLTDGECLADKAGGKKGKPAYRVSEEELGAWTVSRKDVAHFVADAILNRWDEYEDKIISIAY